MQILLALLLLAGEPNRRTAGGTQTGFQPNGKVRDFVRLGGSLSTGGGGGVVDAGNAMLSGYPIALGWQCDAGTTVLTQAPVQTIVSTRASEAYCERSDGIQVLMPTNTVRLERLGMRTETASANDVTAPRDGTDVSWVKVDVTATRVTGADGVAASGTTFTATSNGGTALTVVTALSATRSTSMRVKKRTTTGTIKVTRNNLSTKVDIAPYLSTTTWKWVRSQCGGFGADKDFELIDNCIEVAALTAAVVNPTIGFEFQNSGDAIDVDFVQDEAASFASSPMAGFSRAKDNNNVASTASLPVDNGEVQVDVSLLYDPGAGAYAGGNPISTSNSATLAQCGLQLSFDGTTGRMYEDQVRSDTTRSSADWTSGYPIRAANARNYRVVFGGSTAPIWQDGMRISNAASSGLDCHTNYAIGQSSTANAQLNGWVSKVKWTAGAAASFHGSAKTIILVGDSLVEGNRAVNDPFGGDCRPQALLSMYTGGRAAGVYVSNSGTSTFTIDQCSTTWDSYITQTQAEGNESRKPMLLQCGTNSSSDTSVSVFDKIAGMYAKSTDAGIPTVVATITPAVTKAAFIEGVNWRLRAWAADAGVCFADTFAPLVDLDGVTLKSQYDYLDGVHLNDAGTAVMVQTWTAAANTCGAW